MNPDPVGSGTFLHPDPELFVPDPGKIILKNNQKIYFFFAVIV